MRKNIFQAIYTVLMGLFIYSCSEPVLPKQVGVKGTVNLPIRVGAADLNEILENKIKEAFDAGKQEGTKVYNVDYNGQTVQTFCINIPIEMTEDLNPNNFLKTIDRQINGNMKEDPRPINRAIPYTEDPIPVSEITLFDDDTNKIPHVSLAEIAGYVITIDFGKCEENVDSGIGLNFYFDKIPPGLAMTLKCEEIDISTGVATRTLFETGPKELFPGPNKFGNDTPLTLEVNEYQDDARMLNFTMTLESTDSSHPDIWPPDGVTVKETEIIGEVRPFRVWTEAKIDLANALKASSTEDNIFGRFPATPFDLSKLDEYFNGGFTFNGMEVKIYMDGPDPDSINELEAMLELNAQYDNKEVELYYGALSINSEPIKPDDYLNEQGSYKYQHLPLPGNTSGYDGTINEDAIADIFITMPDSLSFIFRIIVDKELIVYPYMFDDSDNSGANSSIMTTMMIMLPMSLTATGDDDNKSMISFPDMFGKDDLFGREEPEDLFSEAVIDYIRMSIDFSGQIFTNGCLFINENKDLFSQGIRLNGNKIVLNFTNEEYEIIQKRLIFPDVKIEFDKGGTINVPKRMGIVSITIEMKGLINIGELLE